MSRELERDSELREAAEQTALRLGFVEIGHNQRLIDRGTIDEETLPREVRRLMDAEDDCVAPFDGDADLAVEWIARAVAEAAED